MIKIDFLTPSKWHVGSVFWRQTTNMTTVILRWCSCFKRAKKRFTRFIVLFVLTVYFLYELVNNFLIFSDVFNGADVAWDLPDDDDDDDYCEGVCRSCPHVNIIFYSEDLSSDGLVPVTDESLFSSKIKIKKQKICLLFKDSSNTDVCDCKY